MKVDKANLIEEWLKKGDDNKDDIIDIPWDVDREDKKDEINLFAKYPRFPFDLVFKIKDDITVIVLNMKISMNFFDDLQKKLKIYHTLLALNGEIPHLKFSLLGENSTIVIISEIETSKIDYNIFADQINMMFFAANDMVQNLDLRDMVSAIWVLDVRDIIKEKIKKGSNEDKIISYLKRKLKVSAKMAREMIIDAKEDMKNEEKTKTTNWRDMYI